MLTTLLLALSTVYITNGRKFYLKKVSSGVELQVPDDFEQWTPKMIRSQIAHIKSDSGCDDDVSWNPDDYDGYNSEYYTDDAAISEADATVQAAYNELSTTTLLDWWDIAGSDLSIYTELTLYFTLTWAETLCEWLVDVWETIVDGWNYVTVAVDAIVDWAEEVWSDVEETVETVVDWFCSWLCLALQDETLDQDFRNELHYLYYVEHKTTLAKWKYTFHKMGQDFGEVADAAGLTEDELIDAIKDCLKLLINTDSERFEKLKSKFAFADTPENREMFKKNGFGVPGSVKDNFRKLQELGTEVDCEIADPVSIVNTYYQLLATEVADFLYLLGIDTTVAMSFGWGVEACLEFYVGVCIGGTMGFAADLQGNSLLFVETYGGLSLGTSNTGIDGSWFIDISFYDDINNVPGTAHALGVAGTYNGYTVGIDLLVSSDWSSIFGISLNMGYAIGTEIEVSYSYSVTEVVAYLSTSALNAKKLFERLKINMYDNYPNYAQLGYKPGHPDFDRRYTDTVEQYKKQRESLTHKNKKHSNSNSFQHYVSNHKLGTYIIAGIGMFIAIFVYIVGYYRNPRKDGYQVLQN